ncbi:MAG: enoyl-CoA hydratase/isomerase family protein [Firmicutes bacterium]|nr:enoyl-CoA hydratase/isomerase family protein [Bacillota bacterium]
MAIAVDVVGQTAWITVARPEARNAMTFAMYDAFLAAVDDLNARDALRVVVIRGAGGTFVAGTDIAEFRTLQTEADALAYERRIDAVVGRVERMRKVTIAMIDGFATGGGLTLALACDLRYAASTARLGIPIARTLGNCLSMANYARLVDAVGPTRAKDLLLTARLLSAAEARAAGLVTEVVAPEALEAHVRQVAETIGGHAPLTLEVSKEAIRRILARRREVEGDDLILRCYLSADFREGVEAFLAKRTPVWRGR